MRVDFSKINEMEKVLTHTFLEMSTRETGR